MTLLEQFFSWITQAVQCALDILDGFINNSVTGGFMTLFIVVFAFVMIMKYVIHPLFSGGGSDTVKNSKRNKKDE